MAAIAKSIYDEALLRLKDAELGWCPADRFYLREVPQVAGLKTPCVVVAPGPTLMPNGPFAGYSPTNNRSLIVYQFFAIAVRASTADSRNAAEVDRDATAVERMRIALDGQRLIIPNPGVCVCPCRVTPGAQYIASLYQIGINGHFWLVQVPTLEVRERDA